MIHGKRVVVMLPAYNAKRTLRRTIDEIPPGFIDPLFLVEDGSSDRTASLSRELGLRAIRHDANRGTMREAYWRRRSVDPARAQELLGSMGMRR